MVIANVHACIVFQGPVVQNIVSLTSSLVVKILTVLITTISNSQVFLLKKMCICKSYSHFFSKNISVHAIFNDQSFNDTLNYNIVSFEQLSPVVFLYSCIVNVYACYNKSSITRTPMACLPWMI